MERSDRPVRLLYIGEHEHDATSIRRLLSQSASCQFQLEWASTAERALALLMGSRCDLCLIEHAIGMQIGLRNRGGLAAHLPVVVLGGGCQDDALTRLDLAGLTPLLLERSILYAIEAFRHRHALWRVNAELEVRVRERTEALEQRNRELERFAFIASHELQLPLKTISMHIEQMRLRAAAQDADDLHDYFLSRAHEGACRMQSIITRVLDYSRVDRCKSQQDSVDLNAVVAELIVNLGASIAEHSAQVWAEALPFVQGDAVLIAQLFQNLVENALKYRREATPRISIHAELRRNEWCCIVEDNGRGIDPREHEQVFAMFHRGHAPNAPNGEGIGLAFCKRIVEHHGGRIWVESKVGIGSRFHFTFPVANLVPLSFSEAAFVVAREYTAERRA